MYVLDSSIALSWCFHEEITAAASELLQQAEAGSAVVPSLWYLEIANVLLLAERRQRITTQLFTDSINLLTALPIVIDDEAITQSIQRSLSLGRRFKLTSYDATYLELAFRRGLPLASKDAALRDAAALIGVPVLPAETA